MLAHNRKRMQQHPYSREEHFLATEKIQLQSLPHDKFEVRHYADLQVGLNGCIYLGRDKHHYSVPYIHIGEKSRVIYILSPVINATSKQDKTRPLPLHSFVDKQSAKAAFGVISVDFRVA